MKTKYLALFLLPFFTGVEASTAHRHHLVRVFDHLGEEEVLVLSDAEVRELQEDIRSEAQFYMRALANAQVKWRQERRSETFPRANINQRRIQRITSHNSRAEAEERLQSRHRAEENANRNRERRDAANQQNQRNTNNRNANDRNTTRNTDARQERDRVRQEALEYYMRELETLKREQRERDAAEQAANPPR